MTEYQKLTSYFGERKRSGGAFVADALLELYGRHEIAASILLRGTEGFGLKHHLRTDRSLSLSEDLPMVAVAVDTRPRIEELLGPALALNRAGLWDPKRHINRQDLPSYTEMLTDQVDGLTREESERQGAEMARRGMY